MGIRVKEMKHLRVVLNSSAHFSTDLVFYMCNVRCNTIQYF